MNADALVLFGATGDLAKKKLFPALYDLQELGELGVPVVGAGKYVQGVPEGSDGRCDRLSGALFLKRRGVTRVNLLTLSGSLVDRRICGYCCGRSCPLSSVRKGSVDPRRLNR